MENDRKWQKQYERIMKFMEENHKRPSKYKDEECRMVNWIKYNKKLAAKGQLQEDRVQRFSHLLETAKSYRMLNQYKYSPTATAQ